MKNLTIVLASLFLIGNSAVAHEGHDHDAPAPVQAPKGGTIKGLETTFVEVVNHKQDLKIYIYDKELKPVAVAAYAVRAKTELPRSKKQQDLVLTDKGQHFEAQYDAKGAHRYTLILSLKQPTETHQDTLKFTVEPRKSQ